VNGLLLRFSAPMQSWGEHSTFSERDTLPYPTRSGLIGLIAAAMGRKRGESLADLDGLRMTVRVDRPGIPMSDFHTVGGGLPRNQTVITSEGNRRAAGKETIVSRRIYLADAVFVAAIEGEQELIERIEAALRQPVWGPYLGRRSCPPDPLLLLGGMIADPVAELHRVPLARRASGEAKEVEVDFIHETPPGERDAVRTVVNDIPETFHPHRRRYRERPVYIVPTSLPASLCAGLGAVYLTTLIEYLEAART
jgi:CRISPR system Cascade subunit CasD